MAIRNPNVLIVFALRKDWDHPWLGARFEGSFWPLWQLGNQQRSHHKQLLCVSASITTCVLFLYPFQVRVFDSGDVEQSTWYQVFLQELSGSQSSTCKGIYNVTSRCLQYYPDHQLSPCYMTNHFSATSRALTKFPDATHRPWRAKAASVAKFSAECAECVLCTSASKAKQRR